MREGLYRTIMSKTVPSGRHACKRQTEAKSSLPTYARRGYRAILPRMSSSSFLRHAKAGFLALALGLLPAMAFAQAPSLYGAGVAESAILVRLVNASGGGALSIPIGAQTLEAAGFGSASAYKPVAADIYTLFYGAKRFEFLPETQSYYTIVALDGGLVILKDTRHADPARAQLYFYNMGANAAADLKTADGSVAILPAVALRSSAQVAVNPVSLKIAAFQAGARVGGEHALSLARGSSYALFLALQGGSARSFVITASVQAD